MRVSFAVFALAAALAQVQVHHVASASVSVAGEEKTGTEEREKPLSIQHKQYLRRTNVFNNNNSNVVDIIVVLKEEGRRNLNEQGQGKATAAERKADAEANKAAASAAAESMGAVARLTYGSAIYGFAATVPPGLLKQIEADSRVAYVEMDGIINLDPMEMEMGDDRRQLAPPPGKGPNQDGGGDDGPAQEIPWGIKRVNGGTSSYLGTGKAWVIDSGIDLDHPDLKVDVANSETFIGGNSDADDENGHGSFLSYYFCQIFLNDSVLTPHLTPYSHI